MSDKRTGVAALEPLDRETTASIIADRIREAIMQGALTPGAQLVEAELASRFRVSRGPVREAIQRLVQEGLLTSERFRGVFVTSLDNQQTRDLYLARRAIERAAVETLTKDPTPEQLSRLNELLARMQRAAGRNRWADLASLDLAFHEALVAATESKRLVRMFRTLIVETSICVAALKPAYPHLKTLVEEHETLLQAIERGDTKRALQLVDEHLESAVRDLTTRSPS